MSKEQSQMNYISNILIDEIVEQLSEEVLCDFNVIHSKNLDGFMSTIYAVELITKNSITGSENVHKLIVKFMKGDKRFRCNSQSYIQAHNEILIYSEVIPYYDEIISRFGLNTVRADDWIAKAYVSRYGYIEGLSDDKNSNESVLVIQNLKYAGYVLGPRLYLDREHLIIMTSPLASFHAMTYVLKIRNDPQLKKFVRKIVPLPFVDQQSQGTNFYDILYRLAFDRFYSYFDREKDSLLHPDNAEDIRLVNNLNRIRSKFGERPNCLLEYIGTIHDEVDQRFATILHGDFNRNNVMFRYENSIPRDVKMIDFQEVRYATPAIDLSFCMYMNMESSLREDFWMELLNHYHSTMFDTMSSLLESEKDARIREAMNHYKFQEFYRHFAKYAFYGAMICMEFLPWMCSSEEECRRLSHLFETNVYGDEFRKLSHEAGGDDVNRKIFEIIRHASRMGYMDNL